ncbi:ATP-binding protein [Sphingomonas lacunae]|uniref:ATP-binding protein n=1 Tax=Sphingomonas lacunae TaxID=2698828 RepID=A0A6M4AT50_9SPHN|nr:ATP-binding protein [Sphingomonas lacunae]QJQ31590.1 ATP-binding protein [Sphingomonas lacunae]
MNRGLIVIAGAESTGKSALAAALAAHFAVPWVDEYARDYCARHGNDLSAAQLLHVAREQDRLIRDALLGAPLVIADTDAVVTAVWAGLSGEAVDGWYADGPVAADLYLVLANDLPWEDDGVRVQRDPAARDAFRAAMIAELDRRGLRWLPVAGEGKARLHSALAALATTVDDSRPPPC